MKPKLTFKEWMSELRALAEKHNLAWLVVEDEAYQSAWEDGTTPLEQLEFDADEARSLS